MAFKLGWGIYGIMLSAILDEGCRSYFYWRRWGSGRWRHTHVHALEAQALK
jgi:Na+-driven multidrug efflux pump